jgi:very-short-patch-repair endonuclease
LSWQWVRNRQICHQKFRREYPLPPDTADFCCDELELILEIDGAEHFTEAGNERDQTRDEFLNRAGYRIVRIAGFDVLREGEAVSKRIAR